MEDVGSMVRRHKGSVSLSRLSSAKPASPPLVPRATLRRFERPTLSASLCPSSRLPRLVERSVAAAEGASRAAEPNPGGADLLSSSAVTRAVPVERWTRTATQQGQQRPALHRSLYPPHSPTHLSAALEEASTPRVPRPTPPTPSRPPQGVELQCLPPGSGSVDAPPTPSVDSGEARQGANVDAVEVARLSLPPHRSNDDR